MPFGFGGGPWWLYSNYSGRFPYSWWRCFRFPWLPRWWWAYPYFTDQISPTEEKEILSKELEILREEMKNIEERIKELEKKKK